MLACGETTQDAIRKGTEHLGDPARLCLGRCTYECLQTGKTPRAVGWRAASSSALTVIKGNFILSLSIYFEREREQAREQGRGRERGREGIPSRLCALSTEPDAGLEPRNREIVT